MSGRKVETLRCKQGGGAWLRARLGIPTASRLSDIVTPTGKPTRNAARARYVAELVTERLTMQAAEHVNTYAMQRGTDAEPQARAWYSLTTGADVEQVGMLLLHDAWGSFGASPDGLVGKDGGIEIKCPMPPNLVSACMWPDPPEDYMPQVQAALWLTGRKWWDLILFGPEPGLPRRTWRIEPDAGMHDAFESALPGFCKEVDDAEFRMREIGGGLNEEQAAMQAAIYDAMDPTADWGKEDACK
jgi:hypothetical protein